MDLAQPLDVSFTHTNAHLMVSLIPPKGQARAPCKLCCVVDTSGSMGSSAVIKGEGKDLEETGLSVLDIVKHSVKTIIATLEDQDELAIVEFNSKATVLLPLTSMAARGKVTANKAVDALDADGSTNLWDGLVTGLNLLKGAQGFSSLLLLTDGEPTKIPAEGHSQALANYRKSNPFTCSISTFGFGYVLDSPLLNELGSGKYSFIPDAGLVGTVFIHALSNILSTYATNVFLELDPKQITHQDGLVGGFTCSDPSKKKTIIPIGSIQNGQQRDIIIPITSAFNPSQFSAKLCYSPVHGKPQKLKLQITDKNSKQDKDSLVYLESQLFRIELVQCLQNILKYDPNAPDIGTHLPEAQKLIDALAKKLKDCPQAEDQFVQGMLQDLEGQISEAISKQEWYSKWGFHYLPSLLGAHLYQQCNNFKDPGIQFYGGELFSQIRDKLDELFLGLPAPRPSFCLMQQAPAPVNMAHYHDAGGG